MLKRIIPCLDVKDGRVVKGVSFGNLVDAGNAVELARQYDSDGADELAFLDITASLEGRRTFTDLLSRVAEQIFIPLSAGGGVSTPAEVGRLLRAGADKVTINTAAVNNPELIAEASSAYGAQCIVLAIDAAHVAGAHWQVYTHGGRRPTELDAVEWAARAVALGAGEILLTSIDADGRQTGYDLALTRAVSLAVPVPVIASGGAGSVADIQAVLTTGRADAALLASLLHFGQLTVGGIKAALAEHVPLRHVRPPG